MKLITIFFTLLFSANVFAGYAGALLNTTTTLPIGAYRFYLGPDIECKNHGGTNALAIAESAIDEVSSARILAATGHTDFMLGGSYKYEIFPIAADQAGFSLIGEARYLRDNKINSLVLEVAPIVGTKLDLDFADFEPYAGFELGSMFTSYNKELPINILFGIAFYPNQVSNFSFIIEGNFSIYKSTTYLGIGLAFTTNSKK